MTNTPPLTLVTDKTHPLAAAALGIEAAGHSRGWRSEDSGFSLWSLQNKSLMKPTQVPIPGWLWDAFTSAGEAIMQLSARMQSPSTALWLATSMPSDLYGMAFSTQCWAVTSSGPEETREILKLAREGRLDERYNHVVSRIVTAVGMDGHVAYVERYRSPVGDVKANIPSLSSVHHDGDVPDAMMNLVAALRAARARLS